MEPAATPYQVFINHRGKDTKLTLASLIYHALEPYGLRVFLDQYVLCPGDTMETEIRGAISSSSVHIALFSKNYAESRWCLKELCWMLTSSHEPWFIPIFCDVEPWELRFIDKGCYAEAFQKHRERVSMEVADEWKEALGKAADISGKVFKGKEALGKAENNSDTVFKWKESDDQGKFQRDIANAVMKHVKWDPLELPPHAVGLDQAWKDLHDQIKKQSSIKVVVIAGLGGIGKSTLARHIFNELSRSDFSRASYLFNVRETDEHDLQQHLCRDLLGQNSFGWELKTMLRKSLKGLKILIVFDDVDKWDKIERVLDVHAVEEGSLIFVTSRDKDVVRASYKNTSFVYDVQPLKHKHARDLFCYHATRQSNSLEWCADLVEEFLKICGGLPLALQVLGEQLSSNSDRMHWERQLKLYSQGTSLPEANDVINNLLKWICKDMDSEQRRMQLEGIEKNVTKEERAGELEGIKKKVLKKIQWENVSAELRPEQLEVAAQVFINHRVADVKHTLASHVYYSLANCYGLRVFMDEEQISTENYPSSAILTAIRSASVHLVFFSENYAELPWCLTELCMVLGSSHQHTVIPVFCDVEPDDLRYIDNGRYAEAFKAYELKRRNTIKGEASKEAQGKAADQVTMEVEEWKEALGKAADIIPHYRFKTKESDHGQILEKIEENVLKELRWEPVEVHPHVFISHRGPNFEMSLASLMYNRLKICGFLGFHDNKELQTADTLSPATLGAIRSASLHIAIFSEGYAESRQCLDELSSILKSYHENGSSIIPVFCGVKPPDLLNIEGGCYAQAFDKHQREGGVSAESVEGWKMALREVSKLSGLLFQTDKSDYGEFLQIFVEVVLNKIKREKVEVAPRVFINHNGPNVKVTIASLIENRLKICGLRIFQDNKEIHTGDTLSNSIVSAIRTASIHIVIFSQGYAESRQCLDELSWIFRSSPGSKIIPVYCDVEPDDLHYIYRGCYSHAFEKHLLSDKVERKVVDTWENALRQASASSGLFFNRYKSEREFLEEIVSNVLDGVEREPLEVATHPVGIDRAAQDFQNEIMNQSKSEASRIVKIAGIGGVGKSTLVKYIFNLRNSDFRRSCYLSTNREQGPSLSRLQIGNPRDMVTVKKSTVPMKGKKITAPSQSDSQIFRESAIELTGEEVDIPCLQRQLLRDLLGIDEFIVNIREGKRILRGHLAGLQILLVLDGFDHIEPIDSLVDVDALGAGSLILLTARDRESSPKTLSYDVKPLNRRHAKELFCRHAFLQFKPLEGYEDLVEKFLEICGGLPLSLEVVGGLLAGNLDKTYWMLQLKMFSKRLPDQILDTLKASYQKLNKEEKEMYLDIGCFLAGEDIELAVRVLQGSGYTNVRGTLDSLRRKCLLDFESDVESSNDINYKYEHPDIVRLKMHNHLTGFARHIAREEFIEFSEHKPFRLSCSNDMNQILQLQDGSDFCRIRGIRIPKSQNPPQPMNHRSIRDIRFLVVEHPMDLSSFRMHGDLVWLRLDNFPSISIPSTISLANLRVLELHSPGHHGEQLFQAYDELPSELREFHPSAGSCSSASASRSRQLFDTLQNVMPSFSRFLQWTGTFMNKIVLKNMDTLESFPIDFAELKNLRHLDLSGCIHLTELPNSFSQLLELQYLALRDCKNLYMPTDILGEISSLEYVDFKGCAQLVHLPEGIARQRSLRYLNLLCTPKLQLPINLELLNRLEQLRIGSPLLTELPHSGDHLMSLQVLVLIECWGLNNILPRDISGPNVKVLVIRDSPITNFGFEDQGTTLVSKGALKELSLRHTSISEIYIPEGVYPSLETVDLSENIGLTQVKGLPSTLTRLSLQGCREMKSLTNLSNLVNLKFLNINGCLGLETLNIEGLISLEEIKAEGCWKLEKIRGLSQRERLNCLKISTDNSVIWNDICKFLTLRRSYGKLSIASFSGTTDVKTVLDDREIRWTMEKFNVKMVDIVSAATTTAGFHVKLDNFHSHGAILMCFITSGVSPGLFRVRFEASNYGGPTEEYTNLRGRGGGGKCVHVFMWTEDSHLFRDSKDYIDIDVYCSHVDASEMDATHVERGWMVLVDKDTDFSRVCKEFIVTVTKNMFR